MIGTRVAAGILGFALLSASCSGPMETVYVKDPVTGRLIVKKVRPSVVAPTIDAPAGSLVAKIKLTTEAVGSSDVDSQAAGAATLVLSPDLTRLQGALLVQDLSSDTTSAFIRRGAADEEGNAVKTLNMVKNMSHWTWTKADKYEVLTDELVEALLNGKLYISIATKNYPGGELRGQIVFPATTQAPAPAPAQ